MPKTLTLTARFLDSQLYRDAPRVPDYVFEVEADARADEPGRMIQLHLRDQRPPQRAVRVFVRGRTVDIPSGNERYDPTHRVGLVGEKLVDGDVLGVDHELVPGVQPLLDWLFQQPDSKQLRVLGLQKSAMVFDDPAVGGKFFADYAKLPDIDKRLFRTLLNEKLGRPAQANPDDAIQMRARAQIIWLVPELKLLYDCAASLPEPADAYDKFDNWGSFVDSIVEPHFAVTFRRDVAHMALGDFFDFVGIGRLSKPGLKLKTARGAALFNCLHGTPLNKTPAAMYAADTLML
jgi:hypothetical protein